MAPAGSRTSSPRSSDQRTRRSPTRTPGSKRRWLSSTARPGSRDTWTRRSRWRRGWNSAAMLSASDVPETDPWEVNTFAQDMAGPFPLARRPWRDVTCCPPNVTRMLASLPGYCYGQSDEGLWVHLYGASRVRAAGLDVEQRTVFPWEGRVELHVAPAPGADPDVERSLFLRVPSWSSRTVVAVNGAPWSAPPVPGEYLEIRTRWSPDDVVVIDLDVRR